MAVVLIARMSSQSLGDGYTIVIIFNV
jgi:hypothetical protein